MSWFTRLILKHCVWILFGMVILAAAVLMFAGCQEVNAVDVSLVFTWTAPGDDGMVGKAAQYDFRYTTDTLKPWEEWIPLDGEPVPDTAYTRQSWEKTVNLYVGTTYYFALKAGDEKPNWSDRSNIVGYLDPDVIPPSAPGTLTVRKK